MATAQSYLANNYGVSMETAYAFVVANLNTPQVIFDVCKQFGVTNNMLAEIVSTQLPGVDANLVANFFLGHGINPYELDINSSDGVAALGTLSADATSAIQLLLTAGHTYVIDLQAVQGSSLNPAISSILNPQGAVISGAANTDYGISQNAHLVLTPSTTGMHTINVQSESATTGNYELSVLDLSATQPPEDTSLSAGTVFVGRINHSFDTQKILMNLTAGQEYSFTIAAASSGNTLNAARINGIYDESGKVLASSSAQANSNGSVTIKLTPAVSGNYYALIGDRYDDIGGYVFSYAPVTNKADARSVINLMSVEAPLTRSADLQSADTSTTGSVVVNNSVVGEIDPSYDIDWYAVSLVAGQSYTIRLQGSSYGNGTLVDPVIAGVYDSLGQLVSNTYADDQESRDARLSFTPNTSGTYYIAADAWSNYTGSYLLSVSAESSVVTPSDAVGSTIATAANLSVGSSATGVIETSTDVDWFAVTLTAGQTYTIRLQGASSNQGTLGDPLISGVYDNAGQLLSNTYADDQEGRDSRLSFTPNTSGTYYIAAEGWSSYTGTYTISVNGALNDLPATSATTGTVSVGGSTTVAIDANYDHDWYAVNFIAGNTYQISLSSPNSSSYPTIYGIYDSHSSYVGGYSYANYTNNTAVTTFTPSSSGVYYIDAYAYSAGSYTLSVAQISADIAANTSTTGQLAIGSSVTGSIESIYDQDWYAVSLTAGNTYSFTMAGSPSNAGTLPDALINYIYDSYGQLVSGTYADGGYNASGSYSYLDAQLIYTPLATGVYYVNAAGWSSYTGTYTLSASLTSSDLPATTSTSGVVAVGGSVAGTYNSQYDHDWYAVSLNAGYTYQIQVQGSSTGTGLGTLVDPVLYGLYNSSGSYQTNTYADNNGNNLDALLIYTPSVTGTYYIDATAYSGQAGSYTVSVLPIANVDLPTTTSTTGQLLINSSITGTVDSAQDRDWFAVTLNAGQRYQFDLLGSPTSDGTLTDPYLYGIYNSAGTLLANTSNDDAGEGYNARVIFDPTTSGTYYVSAGAYGSGIGSYRLQLTNLGTTDIAADLSTQATVSVGGVVNGLIDTSGDRDWYAVTLEAGYQYTINLNPSSNSNTPLYDPYLYGIYDVSGLLKTATADDDSGPGYGAQVSFAPTSTGIYYISAGGANNYTGSYQLTVSTAQEVTSTVSSADIPANSSTLATTVVGASSYSQIESAGDQDWFSVSLTAGHTYGIALAGAPSGQGTLTDPYLRGIYSATGNLISATSDDDSGYGNDALVNFTPSTTGTYYIAAGGYASSTGSYKLSVVDNTATSTSVTPPVSTAAGTWTVMVYVAADNNLESFALSDINEMEAANLPSGVRVATLVDRATGYSTADGNWTDTRFGVLSHDDNMNAIGSSLTSWGERDMGSAATLTEFINAAKAAAPADHYALIIWNHGGGITGTSWDDASYGSNLTMAEMSQAISASNQTSFDIIGFDACLQGVLDQSYSLRQQSTYQILSQNLEPGDGWDYTNWLSVFNQNASPTALQVANAAVTTYASFYQAQGDNSITLSVIDSAEVADLASAWSSFATAVNATGSSAIANLEAARTSTLTYMDAYVDLYGLMTHFMQTNSNASLDTSAQAVINALTQAVVTTGGDNNAYGLTVFLPETSSSAYFNANSYPLSSLAGISDLYHSMWV